MAGWSRIFSTINLKSPRADGLFRSFLRQGDSAFENKAGRVRPMSEHRLIPLIPTYWQWHKTKDWAHFYFFVGAIPAGMIVFYANVFIGPATLEEIPEGYEPKYWEYHRHPISRFLARYVFLNPQQEYEKLLALTVQSHEAQRARKLESEFMRYRHESGEYKTWKHDMRLGADIIIEARKRMDEAGIVP